VRFEVIGRGVKSVSWLEDACQAVFGKTGSKPVERGSVS
jgi:hypothetical protein